MALYYRNDLRCASLPAFEGGIFCLLFFAAEKKEVAEGMKRKILKKLYTSLHHNTRIMHTSHIFSA